MNAHAQKTGVRVTPKQVSIFICNDCFREENRNRPGLPDGWDRLIDCGGRETVRCPDCNEAIEQKKTAEINRRIIDAGIADIGGAKISMPAADAEKYRITPTKPCAFAVFLEKQICGDYRVAMMPEASLMRWLSLGFFLTADEADALAVELKDFAKLARSPGTLPDQRGTK